MAQCSYTIGGETDESQQCKSTIKHDGLLDSFFCRVSQFWPVRFVVCGFQALVGLVGFSCPRKTVFSTSAEGSTSPSVRHCRSGRKRLRRATRLVLAILPRWLQCVFGYPVCTSIGCSVSPEVRCSPTKPCGKGSKRKQADLDEEDLEQQSWVEALTQELTDNSVDPDYEPSAVETDSEEYRTHNDTESDTETEKEIIVIKDLVTEQVA